MSRFLGVIVFLLFVQSGYTQNRIEINYITDTQVSFNLNNALELKTRFTVSENGFASKIRLFNSNIDNGDFVVKLLEKKGNNYYLIAGPYAWRLQTRIQEWSEFYFPSAVPVYKDVIYILSVSKSVKLTNSNKPSSPVTSYSATKEPNILDKKIPSINIYRGGLFNYITLITVYPKLIAGSIGPAQVIGFNTRPEPLSQYSSPSGGTGTYTYQWQSSSDNIIWTNISGANQPSYSPPALTVSTWYRLNVNSGNFIKESSNPVLIKVYPKLISGTIGHDQTISYNSVPETLDQISPPSGGTGSYIYQWQNSPDNINWTDLTGASLSSYSPPALTTSTWYRLRVMSGYGVFSNPILIKVNPELISGSIGRDQTIHYNSAPETLTQISPPSGGTGSYIYQWQNSLDNINWKDIKGANLSSYSPPALIRNTWYRLKVMSGYSVVSNPILIKVNPELISGSIGRDQTIQYNSAPETLTQISPPSGGTGFYIYQWQNSPDNVTWTDITGASLPSYSPPALTTSTWYRVKVMSGYSVNSNPIFIKVNPELISGTIGYDQTTCINAAPKTLAQISQPSGGTGSYIYQWQNSTDYLNWTDITGAGLSSYSPPALTTSTWYRLRVASGYSVYSNQILIKVLPELISGTVGNDQTICNNSYPEMLVQISPPSGGTGEYSFQWQSSSDNLSWRDINAGNNANYSPSTLSEITWFRRTVISGCKANSNPVKISLYPQFNSAQLYDNKTIYENTSTTFRVNVSGGTPPYTIDYSVNGVAQPAITGYISGDNKATGVLLAGTYVYSLTSVKDLNGCSAQGLGSSITINVISNQVASTNKALVLVNSSSTSYPDYYNYIKPYLDNFGIPYDVCNVNTTSLPSFNDYSVIIFGHKNVYSSGYPISQLEAAVSAGTGLYSFDPHLFDYSSGFNNLITQRSASSAQISILNLGHFITRSHAPDSYNPSNNTVNLLRSWTVVQSSTLPGGIDLASISSGGQNISVLQAASFGNGRIVKWCSYDWMFENILGPVYGMDDLIWRGIVWAARKPFIIQGMPPMLTMRVDDVDGTGSDIENNFAWVKICNEFGIKPWLGLFTRNIPTEYIPTLRTLINSGYTTASPHAKGYATTNSGFIYYNHDNIPSFDPASETRSARDFFIQNGLAMSNFVVPHYYEYASSSLSEIRNMGVEFLGVHWLPDQSYNPSPNWINCAPYRINRFGTSSVTEKRPVYYGGYVNLNGIEFFNCLTEIRDDGGYEWFPDNSITATAARGVRHLRRAFNSMVLATLFTHEQTYIASISQTNWRQILSIITTAANSYNPEYVSIDYAVKYVRAKSNIKITAVRNSLNSLEISCSGYNDMDTKCYLFSEQNGQITYRFITLPRVNGSYTVSVSN